MDATFWHSDVSCDVGTFILVITFLNETYVPTHITTKLFEVNETIRDSMVIHLTQPQAP
jgi:hypothetical protein